MIKQPGMTNAEYLRARRAYWVALGRCSVCCLRTPKPGNRNCDECIGRTAAYKKGPGRASNQRRQRAKHLRMVAARIAAGMCPRCGLRPPVDGYSACSVCLDAEAAVAIQRNRDAGMQPTTKACTVCGKVGHYASRHDRPGVLP